MQLVVLLLAGAFGSTAAVSPSRPSVQTSASTGPSSAAPFSQSTTPYFTTPTQSSVYYFLDVTVNVTETKNNKSVIYDWLDQVLKTNLEKCLEETTCAPTSLPTTNAITPNVTIFEHNNTTTQQPNTSLGPFNLTTSITMQSSSTSTEASTINSPTAATTTSNTTEAETSSQNINSTTTATTNSVASTPTSSWTGLLMDISCAIKNESESTNCTVVLSLNQAVTPCCILKTICTASKKSSDIHVVGNRAKRLNPHRNECGTSQDEKNCCIYSGPLGTACEDSGSAYAVHQNSSTYCGAAFSEPSSTTTAPFSQSTTPYFTTSSGNNCNCSASCNESDAFYTFTILIEDVNMTSSHVSALISKLKDPPQCNISTNATCPSGNISSAYKDVNMSCEVTATNQSCRGILHFAHVVPICSVKDALLILSHRVSRVRIRRAVICGNFEGSSNPLHSLFTWKQSDRKHDDFCTKIIASNITIDCNEVVELNESCSSDMPFTMTTLNPNTQSNLQTTIITNTTTSTPNTTTGTTPKNASTSASGITSKPPTADETLESQANALLNLTRDVSKLTSEDINQLVSKLEKLLSGPTVSRALGNTSVYIVSNLLGAAPEKLSSSSNRIVGIVETVGLKLVIKDTAELLLSPSVALSAKPADGTNFKEAVFSISDPSNVQVRGESRRRRNVLDSSIPQGSITLPSSLTEALTLEEQRRVSRVQFNFYQKSTVFQDRSLGHRKLNSGILGASVANLSIKGLRESVIIRLRRTEPVPANYSPTCVFWDFRLNNDLGGWNSNGCIVQNTTDSETICHCNHLTSFAILLDISREPLTSRVQATILTFITYIGCGISAVFLSITLLTYLAFEKLRKDIPSKILIHLCMALLLLNLVFLVDAWLALYPNAKGLCISTAWFLHYFLLVSFTWMGLEGVHMYMAIVKVFNSHMSWYMLKFSLVGWGVPMLVVIIVIAINKDNYGLISYGKFEDGTSDDFCWLINDIAFYVAVVAYFCVMFLFNFVMFIIVMVQMRRIKQQNPHSVQYRTTLQDVRSVTGITILLGLTWGFAFFAWGPVNLAFMYLFAICNSLQGFFIFVFHCAVKESVRRQWRTYLCIGKMRLLENSEWSRTATQKTTKKSSLTKMTSLHSSNSSHGNNSSSSFSFLPSNSSEQQNGIGSPFEDRAITADEEPNGDVILNEINREYRSQ